MWIISQHSYYKIKEKKENILWEHIRKITLDQLNVRNKQLWIVFIRAVAAVVRGEERTKQRPEPDNSTVQGLSRRGVVREIVFSYRESSSISFILPIWS